MKDINKVILVGRLGANPIQRHTKQGTPVVHFSVATSRRFLKEGPNSSLEPTPTEETQWHRVVAWGKQGEVCAQYLKKGSQVYVEGFLRSHQYEDKSGTNKTSFEIHTENVSFLGNPRTSTAEKQETEIEKVIEPTENCIAENYI